MGIPPVDQTEPRRQGIRRGKTVILTSSPYLKELEFDLNRKRMKPSAKVQLFASKQGCAKGQSNGKGKGKGKGKAHTHGTTGGRKTEKVMRMFHAYTVLGCITNRKVVKSGSCVANVTTGHMINDIDDNYTCDLCSSN